MKTKRDDEIRDLYAVGLTMRECADRFGVTPGRVHQILKGRKCRKTREVELTPIERFWSKVNVTGNASDCWEWTASCTPQGYGHFYYHGRHISAHRASFEFAKGYKPKGWILHHCDNPRCVNPTHLYDGTPQDNADDRVLRKELPTAERIKFFSL